MGLKQRVVWLANEFKTLITRVTALENDNGIKVYKALLTQTGTDAPTAIVLENTLGVIPIFTYNGAGDWVLSVNNSLFVNPNKVYYPKLVAASTGPDFISFDIITVNDISILGGDSTMLSMPFYLEVYP